MVSHILTHLCSRKFKQIDCATPIGETKIKLRLRSIKVGFSWFHLVPYYHPPSHEPPVITTGCRRALLPLIFLIIPRCSAARLPRYNTRAVSSQCEQLFISDMNDELYVNWQTCIVCSSEECRPICWFS